jgi:hypothetical protein
MEVCREPAFRLGFKHHRSGVVGSNPEWHQAADGEANIILPPFCRKRPGRDAAEEASGRHPVRQGEDMGSSFSRLERFFHRKAMRFLGRTAAPENGSKRVYWASLPALTSQGVAGIFFSVVSGN